MDLPNSKQMTVPPILADCMEVYVKEISGSDEVKFNLKWAQIAISNLKILQTYHMISERKVQNYLDDFCYKLNRRYFGKNYSIGGYCPYAYWQETDKHNT